jgi:casein kinase 1
MHQCEVLHRDIQLGNCALGLPPNDKIIYMIDFGFSKRYIDKYTRRHIPDSKLKRDFVGNYWFRYRFKLLSKGRDSSLAVFLAL